MQLKEDLLLPLLSKASCSKGEGGPGNLFPISLAKSLSSPSKKRLLCQPLPHIRECSIPLPSSSPPLPHPPFSPPPSPLPTLSPLSTPFTFSWVFGLSREGFADVHNFPKTLILHKQIYMSICGRIWLPHEEEEEERKRELWCNKGNTHREAKAPAEGGREEERRK